MQKYKINTVESKGAKIIYIKRPLNLNIESIPEFKSAWVLFESKFENNSLNEIFIEHPFRSKNITLSYENSSGNITSNGELVKDIWEYEDELRKSITSYERAAVSVFVKDNKVVAWGVTGNGYHDQHGCERKKRGIVSGQYEICPGCHFDNHSEANAIKFAKENHIDLTGAVNYLYNHWWACEPCSEKLLSAGINQVVFSKSWTKRFLEIKDFEV